MAAVDYITRQQAKDQLELTTATSDTLLDAAITAASRAINDRCKRQLTPKAADDTRTFSVPVELDPDDDGLLIELAPYELRTVTTATLHPEEASVTTVLGANTDYSVWPLAADPITGTWRRLKLARGFSPLGSTLVSRFGVAKLQIRGAWGAWDTADVPEQVKRACVATAGAWVDRAVEEYAGFVQEEGAPRAIRPSQFAGWSIPPAAYSLLRDAGLIRWKPFA